jgi:hypothetical protein
MTGTDEAGLERILRILPFRAGVPVPEWIITSGETDTKGAGGLLGAGYVSFLKLQLDVLICKQILGERLGMERPFLDWPRPKLQKIVMYIRTCRLNLMQTVSVFLQPYNPKNELDHAMNYDSSKWIEVLPVLLPNLFPLEWLPLVCTRKSRIPGGLRRSHDIPTQRCHFPHELRSQ